MEKYKSHEVHMAKKIEHQERIDKDLENRGKQRDASKEPTMMYREMDKLIRGGMDIVEIREILIIKYPKVAVELLMRIIKLPDGKITSALTEQIRNKKEEYEKKKKAEEKNAVKADETNSQAESNRADDDDAR